MGFNNSTAQARMLHRSIAYDGRFNSLTITEQWLYMRMLPFVDDEGKLTGDARELKFMTIPAMSIGDNKLQELLSNIAGTGLIIWEQGVVIKFAGWKKNQKIFHRPKKSTFPDPKETERSGKVRKDPSNIIEKKIIKKNNTPNFSSVDMEIFSKVFPEKDIAKSHEMWLDYLKSSGKKYKDYKAAFRNVLRRDWSPNIASTTKGKEYTLECPECEYQYKTPDRQLRMTCPRCRGIDANARNTMAII